MTNFNTLKSLTSKFITSAGAFALVAGVGVSLTPPAYADDCLLDTNYDGNADSNIDTDGGADSVGNTSRLACGHNASAAGTDSTALGNSASAAGNGSIALGNSASSAGSSSTALGNSASTVLNFSTAVGGFASAAGGSSTALGRDASAAGTESTALGRSASAAADSSTAVGGSALALGDGSTALGKSTNATGFRSTAIGRDATASGLDSTALGYSARAAGDFSTALGYFANFASNAGDNSAALGSFASARGGNTIAIGADSGDANLIGADAQGADSIVIGVDASDSNNAGAIVIGKGATATEANQVILKSADTFTILGNGDVGIGTAAPLGNLDINSGVDDTTLLLTNTSAQWELKSKTSTGRLNFKNLTLGGVPFKLGPNSVNGLLSVGTMADDLVEVRGDLEVEGDVNVTGTLTTGGPTCGGGCDAVFGADYDLPSIEEHAKAMFANKHLPEIGPTVPHAPVNLSEQYGKVINELEKAHIYIAQLEAAGNRRDLDKQAMRAEMAHMKQQIAFLMNQ